MNDEETKSVIIYGAGYLGLALCDMMMEKGIYPMYILDRNAEKWGIRWNGVIDIKGPEMVPFNERKTKIIVAHMDYENVYMEIFSYLRSKGFLDIEHIFSYAQNIDNSTIFEKQKMILKIRPDKIKENQIRQVENKLYDEKSKVIYNQIVSALKRQVFSGVKSLPLKEQYFAYDIYMKNEQEVFLDIGGGPNGDVLEVFIHNYKMTSSEYYLFEPDSNIMEIKKKMEGNKANVHFVNCAIGDKKKKVYVKNYMNMNSLVFDEYEWKGEKENYCQAECISLDDFYFDRKPTFLKIDTEGWEKKVLEGGKKLIEKCRPVIACAIYHKEEDFWEIPLYLMEKLTDYRYYIRSYQNVMETILYAVPRERWV